MNRRGLHILRYTLIASLATLAMTACTLYMDEPEDGDYLRTEAGYLDTETIDLPDSVGTIQYKYNQKTIPINDEVLEYLIKVENDSILYFSGSMPDDILPNVGSMMTSSFKEQFPHAFCHKCIDRTEDSGIYRCVFTKCSLAEAFDLLVIDVDGMGLNPVDPSSAITEEQFDSIMAIDGMPHDPALDADDADYEDEAESRVCKAPWQQPTTRATLGSDEVKRFGYEKPVEVEFPTLSANLEAGVGEVLSAKANARLGGKMTVRGGVKLKLDTSTGQFDAWINFNGQLTITATLALTGTVVAKLPVHVTPLGIQADFLIVGIDIGFTVQPYIKTVQEVNLTASMTYNYDVTFGYHQNTVLKKGEFGILKNACNSPVFRLESAKTDPNLTLSIEAGYDFHVGLGADLLGTGFDVAAGCVVSSSLDVPLNTKKFQTAEDFKKNCLCPTYAQVYVEGCVKVGGVKAKPRFDSPKFEADKKLAIPFFPVIKDWNMKCTDTGKHKYSGKLKLKQSGILTSMLFYTPMVKVYMVEDEEQFKATPNVDDLLAAELPMKLDGFDINGFCDRFVLDWVDKENSDGERLIDFNFPYYVQAGYKVFQDPLKKIPLCWIPLAEHSFEVNVPQVNLKGVRLIRTLSSRNAPNYTVKNGVRYNYCYMMDVELEIEAPNKTPKWGFTMSSGQPPRRTSIPYTQTDHKHKPIVLMYWYSNNSSVDLEIVPQAYVKTGKKVSSWPTDFEKGTKTVSYNAALDINPDLRPIAYDSKASYVFGK